MLPARLLRLPKAGLFAFRFVQLNIGLMLMGMSVAVMLRAQVGLGPVEVFNQGLGEQIGMTLGRATQLSGLLVVGFTYLLLRVRPGIGTLCNMLLVGAWIDVFLRAAPIPTAHGSVVGLLQFELGVVLFAVATAAYITANLGAGPFDNLMLALESKTGRRVGSVRTGIELTLLVAGYLLGGSIGLGTVLVALTVGPLVQLFLTAFRRLMPSGHDGRGRTERPNATGA